MAYTSKIPIPGKTPIGSATGGGYLYADEPSMSPTTPMSTPTTVKPITTESTGIPNVGVPGVPGITPLVPGIQPTAENAAKINAPVNDSLGLTNVDKTSQHYQDIKNHVLYLQEKGLLELDNRQKDYIKRFKAKYPDYANVPDVNLYVKNIQADPKIMEKYGSIGEDMEQVKKVRKDSEGNVITRFLEGAKENAYQAVSGGVDIVGNVLQKGEDILANITGQERSFDRPMEYKPAEEAIQKGLPSAILKGAAGTTGLLTDIVPATAAAKLGFGVMEDTPVLEYIPKAIGKGMELASEGVQLTGMSEEDANNLVSTLGNLAFAKGGVKGQMRINQAYQQYGLPGALYMTGLQVPQTVIDTALQPLNLGKGIYDKIRGITKKGETAGTDTGFKYETENARTSEGVPFTMETPPSKFSTAKDLVFQRGTNEELATRSVFPKATKEKGPTARLEAGKTALAGIEQMYNDNRTGITTADISTMPGGVEAIEQGLDYHGKKIGELTAGESAVDIGDIVKSLEKAMEDPKTRYSGPLKSLAEDITSIFSDPAYRNGISINDLQDHLSTIKSKIFGDYKNVAALYKESSGRAVKEFLDELSNRFDIAIEETTGNLPELQKAKAAYTKYKKIQKDFVDSMLVNERNTKGGALSKAGSVVGLYELFRNPTLSGIATSIIAKTLLNEMGTAKSRGGSYESLIRNLDRDAIQRGKTNQPTNDTNTSPDNSGVAPKRPFQPPVKPTASKSNIIISKNPAEILAFEVSNGKVDIKKAIQEIKKLSPEEIAKHPELVKLQEVDQIVQYIDNVGAEYGALPPDEIQALTKQIQEGGYTPEQKKYILDNSPKEVTTEIQKQNRIRDYGKDFTEKEVVKVSDKPKLKAKTEKKVKAKKETPEVVSTPETVKESVQVKETPEDWTKKDFTKVTESKSTDKYGNTLIREQGKTSTENSLIVGGKKYTELDLPDSSRTLYELDGKIYEYKDGKMISETPKTPQVDTELASLQKLQESLPGLPKVEVPADYVPKDGLPTGTEFESTILPTETKVKGKIPSPDIKRPQIRGIDLGIRGTMIKSLKEQGIFTDSFFAITDKNLANKFIDYAEQKAMKKGASTAGKEVDIKSLMDRAKNSADTSLVPQEYVKGLDGDKGIYLRFDLGDGNKVAVNSSYTDIFFKNFDDVTFKGSNEVSPVVVYSKGKDVGVIMPIKDPYASKEVLGDFTIGKAKTPQVEGKTIDSKTLLEKFTGRDTHEANLKHLEKASPEGWHIDSMKIDDIQHNIRADDFENLKESQGKIDGIIEKYKKDGVVQPIIVNKNGQVLDGNHRINAYKMLGLKEVPVYSPALADLSKADNLATRLKAGGETLDSYFTDKVTDKLKSPLPLSQKSEVKGIQFSDSAPDVKLNKENATFSLGKDVEVETKITPKISPETPKTPQVEGRTAIGKYKSSEILPTDNPEFSQRFIPETKIDEKTTKMATIQILDKNGKVVEDFSFSRRPSSEKQIQDMADTLIRERVLGKAFNSKEFDTKLKGLKNIDVNKPKPSLPLSQKSEVMYSKPIEDDLAPVIKATEESRFIKKPVVIKKDVWRGVSDDQYAGKGMATYGNGLYTTTNKTIAKEYAGSNGKLLEISKTQLPENALHFDTVMDYKNWLDYDVQKKLGMKASEFNTKYPDIGEFIKSLGYDGIVVGRGEIMVTYH